MTMCLFRNLAALCLVLMMVSGAALAEAPFLVHSNGWTLEDTPLEVTLSADVISHMPYDEERVAMLRTVTDDLSLRLNTGVDEGSVTILVGKTEALTVAYLDNALQFSNDREVFYTSSEDPMDKLLGIPSGGMELSLYGLRGDAETLLDDGWKLLDALGPALEKYADRRSVKTNITDMGTARSCTDYTVPKTAAETMLKEILLENCPDGWLKDIISSLTFSGKQTLRVYRTEDEVPLRAEYNGTCGPEGVLRTVKLTWRMRRDKTAHRDEVTLTSPAKAGTDKNTLEFSRVIKTAKSGAVEMEGNFTYTVTASKQTTVRKGEFDLINAFTDESDVISGTVTLQQKLPDETQYAGVSFETDVTISGTQDEPMITGSVTVSTLSGKNVIEQARVILGLKRGEESRWEARESAIDLDQLSEDALNTLRQKILSDAATSIVRPLIILLGDEADWLFHDMSPDAVQRIINASDSVVVLE